MFSFAFPVRKNLFLPVGTRPRSNDSGCRHRSRRGIEGHGVSPLSMIWTAILFAGAGLLQTAPAYAASNLSITCSSASATGSASDPCTVTTSEPVLSPGGETVQLSSSNSAVVVPGSVTIPFNASSAGFTANIAAVTTTQTATLTARALVFSGTFQLTLNAYIPSLTLGSTSVAFGDVNENTTATQSVQITSSGTAPLTISGAAVSGSEFGEAGMSFPVTLNPGQSAELDVQFDPTTAGAANGTVTISSNASNGSSAVIQLSGTGEAASYEVNLTWDAPSESADPVAGYNVYRATSGSSSYQLLNSSVNSSTAYTDTTVVDGVSYTYYVESVDSSGNQSSPSNTYSVTIP